MGAAMRYQPQGRAVLLPQSGADVAFVRLDQKGLVGTAAIGKNGSPTLVSTPYGVGWQFNSTSDQFSATPSWPALADGTEYTYLVVAVLNSVGNIGLLVCGDNTTRSFQFRVETSGAPSLIGFNTAVSTFTATGTPMVVGVPQAIIARQTKGEVSIWQQGRKTSAAAFTGTIKGQAYNEIIVGNRIGAYLRGSIGLVVRWPRALSDAEAAAYSANPWKLFDAGSSSSAYQAAIALTSGVTGGPKSFAYSALGGAVFGGSAAPARGTSRVPVGSLTMGGSGQAIRGAARASQGGLALSGAGSIMRSIARGAVGGLSFAGAATAQRGFVRVSAGGLSLSGATSALRTVARLASSGFVLLGHVTVGRSSISQVIVMPAGDAVTLGGSGAIKRGMAQASSGGMQILGAAQVRRIAARVAAGGMVLDGSVQVRRGGQRVVVVQLQLGGQSVVIIGMPALVRLLVPNPKRTYLAQPRVREYIAQRRVREL